MTTAARAIDAIEQLHTFFVQHQVGNWAQLSRQAIDELGKQGADVGSILRNYTGAGMGSLTDLYISTDNGHTIHTTEQEANKQLEALAIQLFTIQQAISRN